MAGIGAQVIEARLEDGRQTWPGLASSLHSQESPAAAVDGCGAS
jgi:hypothetical protein